MSWFSDQETKTTIFSYNKNSIINNVNLLRTGGLTHLYESKDLPTNCIEKGVLKPIEDDFFNVRETINKHRTIRLSKDRSIIRKYIAAQVLRSGDAHRRIKQMEIDLRFLAKEMGLEKIWGIEENSKLEGRKGASTILANILFDLDYFYGMLSKHAVILLERPQNDILLPDSGIVQLYSYSNRVTKLEGLNSKELILYLPISSSLLIKLKVPTKGKRFKSKETMGQKQYEIFLNNLSLNTNDFVVGAEKVLIEAQLENRPRFDRDVQRVSMVLNFYKCGNFDKIIKHFFAKNKDNLEAPYDFIRHWFYKEKFLPAMNKLFNSDKNPNAIYIPFNFDEKPHPRAFADG